MEKEIIGLFLNECITIDSVGGPASDRGDKVDIGTVIRISKFLCVSLFSEGEPRSVLCTVHHGLISRTSIVMAAVNVR